MNLFDSAIGSDRPHTIAAKRTVAVVPSPLAIPPAFLSMPNWTVDETADYLRCQAQTIRKAISQKGEYHGLKPRRFGRRWYFFAADVRSMLEAA